MLRKCNWYCVFCEMVCIGCHTANVSLSSINEFDDEIWTDAALGKNLKVGGIGGYSQSGHAYQLRISKIFATKGSLKRNGIDINLLEQIAVRVMMNEMAPN